MDRLPLRCHDRGSTEYVSSALKKARIPRTSQFLCGELLTLTKKGGADPRPRQRPPDQEMVRDRRADRGLRLSPAIRRRGRDPALLHHDRHRPDRRHGRPAGADAAHPRRRRLRRAAARAAVGRASELPDVVCGDAGADRRLRAGPALDGGRRRHLGRRPRRAVGRPRDRRAHSCIDGCRTGDNSLRSLPFPSARALWRDRQSARHADRLGLGDAHGPSRPHRHPVRLRRPVLAADGRRHRLDDRRRAVRRASAGRGRPDGGVRGRAAAARHRRARPAVPFENAAALERRRAGRRREPVGGPHAACRMCWFPPTARRSRFAGADGRLSVHRTGRDAFAVKDGSPPTATRGCPTTRPWGRAFAATPPAASPACATASSSRRSSRPTPSRRTAGGRRSWSRAGSCPANARRW